jgi:hypothetical protein
MKKQLTTTYTYLAATVLLMAGAISCQKEISGNRADQNAVLATTATSSTIAVATNGGNTTTGGSTTDSVYVVHTCDKGQRRDSVAASALPATVSSYLTANYSGYSFTKAFAVKDTLGAVKGYVVIIHYNNKPVALQFTADGIFVKVLEQREKGDVQGAGWHKGGRFEKRGLPHKDTITLSALPAAITTYFATHW